MADLATDYLGLTLAHPLVPSASPLSADLDSARRLEDAGASALVMHSLFEEAVLHEQHQLDRFLHHQSLGHAEADSFLPQPPDLASEEDAYLEHLRALKAHLGIPVIASLNGVTPGGWIDHARLLEEAGADALELNVYYVAADPDETGTDIEARYLDVFRQLRAQIQLPITVKLSSQFSSPGHMVRQLEAAGAQGVALFNRFYQPDIDLDTLRVTPRLYLSTSAEALLRIRWVALLYGRVDLSLAVTGGIHTAADAIKALLAGADVTHMCSALLEHGPDYLRTVLADLNAWLDAHEYDSVRQLKGSVSQQHAREPAAFERSNYLDVLDTYRHASGVRR